MNSTFRTFTNELGRNSQNPNNPNNNDQEHINVNDHELDGVNGICSLLMNSEKITQLDLTDTCLGDNGVIALSSSLEHNSSLTSLSLSENRFGVAGARALGDMLKKNRYLSHLDLLDNDFGEDGLTELGSGLKQNHHLCHLDVHPTLSSIASITFKNRLIQGRVECNWLQVSVLIAFCRANGLQYHNGHIHSIYSPSSSSTKKKSPSAPSSPVLAPSSLTQARKHSITLTTKDINSFMHSILMNVIGTHLVHISLLASDEQFQSYYKQFIPLDTFIETKYFADQVNIPHPHHHHQQSTNSVNTDSNSNSVSQGSSFSSSIQEKTELLPSSPRDGDGIRVCQTRICETPCIIT